MSKDIQFISIVDALQVTGWRKLTDSVLRVEGRSGFGTAQKALINGFAITDIQVVSERVLLVSLPSSLQGLGVDDLVVEVVASALTGTRKVKILFGLTLRTKQVSGLQKLVQQVLKEFISRSGSNVFDRSSGGGLISGIGETLDPSGRSRLANLCAQAVEQTKASFLASQSTERNLASSERLQDFRLVGVQYGTSSVEVILRLTTFSGTTLSIPLEV